MSDSPEPLTQAECDLQDFPFMPLMVLRLRKSKAWVKARRNPALGFYMLNLWMAAWHEVPAGSLEDDDDVLADAAMCEPSKWAKARSDVLRGWVKCSDGRLYHPVVAERVHEAWASKVERRKRDDHERDRKRVERDERARLFAALKSAGIHKSWNTGLADLRKAVHDLSGGQVQDGPAPVHDLSRLREGEGEGHGHGEGEGEGDSLLNTAGPESDPPPPPAVPPAPAPRKVLSPEDQVKSEVWKAAVSVLEQGGCPASQRRTFVGKLVTDYGFPIVKEAIAAAVSTQPADAREYLKATCMRLKGERKNRQEDLELSNLGAAARFAGEC